MPSVYSVATSFRCIGRLRNLTCLYVDSNNLKKIPAEIGTLSHLERLTLSNNSLSSLPPEMGALQRLHSLHLANNSLTELPAPLCQLRSLTFLDVSDNKIGTIPSSIRHLEKLETLLLLFNSLESLPEEVCLLRKLRTLWLGNNHLRSLPATFGELVNLDWGYNYCSCNFEGNPLERPPPEVCSRGPEEIRDYFLSFHKTQEKLDNCLLHYGNLVRLLSVSFCSLFPLAFNQHFPPTSS
uniref:Disease resistance R13L4/SHOC-2-like LRR domain-containing protein n=1 Tax=Buteo japonicus TaxID=224669 RepID=A0A8C0HJU7_9AVES